MAHVVTLGSSADQAVGRDERQRTYRNPFGLVCSFTSSHGAVRLIFTQMTVGCSALRSARSMSDVQVVAGGFERMHERVSRDALQGVG